MVQKGLLVVVWSAILSFTIYATALGQQGNYVTAPADLPNWEFHGNFDSGYLFLSNFTFGDCPANPYLLIIDGDGALVYYRVVTACSYATDFKPHSDDTLSFVQSSGLGITVLDNSYKVVEEFPSYINVDVNVHEFLKLQNANVIVPYEQWVATGQMVGAVPEYLGDFFFRELDPSRNTIFEWHSIDHFTLDESVDSNQIPDANGLIDSVHGNAIEVDTDGNYLLSSRHMNEITKISRETGEIIWRFGGKKNQFTLIGDDRWFTYQHDVRRLPNGNITLFDNGNLATPAYSRVVEYTLDEQALTATFVREYRHTPDVFGFAMGSARLQPNGDMLVGWGAHSDPAVTEFAPDGTVAFELSLLNDNFNYRAHRGEWHGYPTQSPTLVYADGALYFSWNGSTETVSYNIERNGVKIAQVLRNDFEAAYPLVDVGAAGDETCTYTVIPVDKDGASGLISNEVTAPCIFQLFLPVIL